VHLNIALPHRRYLPSRTCAGLLLADMFGIGALALPGVFARLGWLVSPGQGSRGLLLRITGQRQVVVRRCCPAGASLHLCLTSAGGALGAHARAYTHAACIMQVSFILLATFGLGCGYLGVL